MSAALFGRGIGSGAQVAFRAARAAPASPPPHGLAEDCHALVLACSFIVFGILCLKHVGLITGGVAGIALCLSYVVHLPVELLFVLLNVPFVVFGRFAFGWGFAGKTVAVNLLVFGMTAGAAAVFRMGVVDPWFAAIFGGTLIGMGLLALARHRASIGGVGVLALFWQERFGWPAGRTLLICDAVIFVAALWFLPPDRLLLSFVSDIAMNLVLVIYHRPGRYLAA